MCQSAPARTRAALLWLCSHQQSRHQKERDANERTKRRALHGLHRLESFDRATSRRNPQNAFLNNCFAQAKLGVEFTSNLKSSLNAEKVLKTAIWCCAGSCTSGDVR